MSQRTSSHMMQTEISDHSMMLSQLSMATSPKPKVDHLQAADRAIIEMCLERKSDIKIREATNRHVRRWANQKADKEPERRYVSESIGMSTRFQDRVKVLSPYAKTRNKRCKGET